MLFPMPACCTACSGVADRAAPVPPHDAHLSVHVRLETPARQGIGAKEGKQCYSRKPKFCSTGEECHQFD